MTEPPGEGLMNELTIELPQPIPDDAAYAVIIISDAEGTAFDVQGQFHPVLESDNMPTCHQIAIDMVNNLMRNQEVVHAGVGMDADEARRDAGVEINRNEPE